MHSTSELHDDQENFVESREPAELIMCIILSAAYAGLARTLWEPLQQLGNWRLMVNVEGFFVTIAILALLVGLRPYLTPSSLQISHKGIKYKGPYWPQRKTVNWHQVFKVYVSPELIVVLYHPSATHRGVWPLFIQSMYLSDKEKVGKAIARFSTVEPAYFHGPDWKVRLATIALFVLVVILIMQALLASGVRHQDFHW